MEQTNVNERCFPVDLLPESGNAVASFLPEEEAERKKKQIAGTFAWLGMDVVASIEVHAGPSVSLYEVTLESGAYLRRLRGMEDDFMLGTSLKGLRIVIPMPSLKTGTIGIEIGNDHPCTVALRDILETSAFADSNMELPVAIGRSVAGEPLAADLAAMPHLLVGGATAQGKTAFLNSLIVSLLYAKRPEELKFVLIDPKGVEFGVYRDLGDAFLAKLSDGGSAVAADVGASVDVLRSLCKEMDVRYALLKEAQVRNVKEYNALPSRERLPSVVAVVDELSDIVMAAGEEAMRLIVRLAQLGRAVGIHIVVSTQRPTHNIITGTLKANFPVRVAFRVSSKIDSRTILDQPGASCLMGCGDLLFSAKDEAVRAQGAWVDMPEIDRVVRYVHEHTGEAEAYVLPEATDGEEDMEAQCDPLFAEASRYAGRKKGVNAADLQRHFAIGCNRATRLLEQLKRAGVVKDEDNNKCV